MFAGGASLKPREAPAIHQNAFIRWPAEMVKVVEMVEKNSRAGQEGTAGLIELRATSTFVLISVTVSNSSTVAVSGTFTCPPSLSTRHWDCTTHSHSAEMGKEGESSQFEVLP